MYLHILELRGCTERWILLGYLNKWNEVNRPPIFSEENKQIESVIGEPNGGDVTITIRIVIKGTCRLLTLRTE